MGYLQGFVIPVKTGNKQAYRDMAAKAAPVFLEGGATRIVECWEDDVPDGKVTDMRRAVEAKEGESIVFSWILWPDKATCDAAHGKMMSDERMQPDGPLPFEGDRMIYAGFDALLDSGNGGAFSYVDGMVASVALDRRDAFADHARTSAALFREKGALRLVDGWGADIPDGKVTDFKRAVEAKDGEAVVFGWIEWPDKATRDAAWGALMQDARMRDNPPLWNGPLAIFGGFAPIFDSAEG